MGEKKEYSRSIRMTNTVKNFIESQEGQGFNEKFANTVLLCMAKIPEIENQIKIKEQQLNDLNKKIAKRQNIISDIDSMRWSINQVLEKAKKIAENDSVQLNQSFMDKKIV